MDEIINVFLSVGNPHKVEQEIFLSKLEGFLKRRKICPLTLGRTNYSPISPLKPVKELMEKCYGAIILGFERTHCLIGYDDEGSEKQNEFTHRYLSTPWNQIEAGMAVQKGVPIIIMKENNLTPYGILDPKLTGYFVVDIDIKKDRFEKNVVSFLEKWIEEVKELKKKSN